MEPEGSLHVHKSSPLVATLASYVQWKCVLSDICNSLPGAFVINSFRQIT